MSNSHADRLASQNAADVERRRLLTEHVASGCLGCTTCEPRPIADDVAGVLERLPDYCGRDDLAGHLDDAALDRLMRYRQPPWRTDEIDDLLKMLDIEEGRG